MKITRKEGIDRIRIVEHNKTLLWIIFGVMILLLILVFAIRYLDSQKAIGGDKDSNGCLIAGGYSWNETKQKCVKEWEESAKTYCTNESRNIGVCMSLWQPVCGNAFELTVTPKTYANSCVACLDKTVEYWINGECSS